MHSSKAFTIVELLIVIVVIAILAAISIVAYNGIQERARVSEVSSALSQAKKKIGVWQVDNPETTPSNLATVGVSSSGNVTFQYRPGINGIYCITATSGLTSYRISNTSPPEKGGCAGHGVGGVAAVTNLVTNPSFAVDTSNWNPGAASLSRITSPWSADGNGAIQITPTGQDSYAQFVLSATPGATYTIIGSLNVPAAQSGSFQGSTQQRNIMPTFWNGAGSYIGSGGGNSNPSPNTAGTYQHRLTVNAPASSSQLRVRLYNGANTGGGSVYWDQIMVTEGSYSGNYADGSVSNWIWDGTPNNSTSTGPAL